MPTFLPEDVPTLTSISSNAMPSDEPRQLPTKADPTTDNPSDVPSQLPTGEFVAPIPNVTYTDLLSRTSTPTQLPSLYSYSAFPVLGNEVTKNEATVNDEKTAPSVAPTDLQNQQQQSHHGGGSDTRQGFLSKLLTAMQKVVGLLNPFH